MPRFEACPADSQKCVSTLNDTGYPAFDPIPFSGSADDAMAAVRAVVDEFPRTTILEDDGHYLKVEFKTMIMRFKDPVQFEVDAEAALVHFRSDSIPQAGSDLGANRKRMEEVSAKLRARMR